MRLALLLLLHAILFPDAAHGRRISGRESLFLTDAANNQVIELDRDGTCRSVVAPTEGEAPFPAGIAFTPDLLLDEEVEDRPDLLKPDTWFVVASPDNRTVAAYAAPPAGGASAEEVELSSVIDVPGNVGGVAVSMAEDCSFGSDAGAPVECGYMLDWTTRGYLAVADTSYRMLRFYAPRADGGVGYEPLVSCRETLKRCTAFENALGEVGDEQCKWPMSDEKLDACAVDPEKGKRCSCGAGWSDNWKCKDAANGAVEWLRCETDPAKRVWASDPCSGMLPEERRTKRGCSIAVTDPNPDYDCWTCSATRTRLCGSDYDCRPESGHVSTICSFEYTGACSLGQTGCGDNGKSACPTRTECADAGGAWDMGEVPPECREEADPGVEGGVNVVEYCDKQTCMDGLTGLRTWQTPGGDTDRFGHSSPTAVVVSAAPGDSYGTCKTHTQIF